jgi:hypothetical protein
LSECVFQTAVSEGGILSVFTDSAPSSPGAVVSTILEKLNTVCQSN